MNDQLYAKLYQTLVGLKNTITDAVSRRKNCHYNIGESLSYVRTAYLQSLEGPDREYFERTVPPIEYSVPRPGGLAIWTVDENEAWRLYSQLVPLFAAKVKEQRGQPSRAVSPNSRNVFLVHGHDEAAREGVARFLERLDFIPIILHEQANSGKTVVEKLEAHSDVAFAVVLLTPDDEGRLRGTEKLAGRARQNVLLELGYFIGLLGRQNVCALLKGETEVPSDYLGVLFTQIDQAGSWRLLLAKEMKAAGLDVDLNLAA